MSDEDRIARVALALCVADGQDPDADITVGSEVVDKSDGIRTQKGGAFQPRPASV